MSVRMADGTVAEKPQEPAETETANDTTATEHVPSARPPVERKPPSVMLCDCFVSQ